MRVAVRREHLIDIALVGRNQFQDRDIERAAAEIVDGDFAALLLVQAVGEGCGCWFIHEAQHFEPGDSSRIFRSLALSVIEIRGDSDYRAIDGFVEEIFGPGFQFAQDECRNLGWREDFVAEPHANHVGAARLDAEGKNLQLVFDVFGRTPHETLHRINCALGLRKQALLRRLSRDDGSVGVHAHNRWTKRRAIRPDDTLRLPRRRVHERDQAVRRPKIDAYDSSHILLQASASSFATLATRFRM